MSRRKPASRRQIESAEGENPFGQIEQKTLNLNAEDLAKQIAAAESPIEQRRLSVALQRKYSAPFVPLVLVFFAAPLALTLRHRTGKIAASLGTALAVWLLFTLFVSIFDRLGTEGALPAVIAVWSPLIVFSSGGWYLLARTKN